MIEKNICTLDQILNEKNLRHFYGFLVPYFANLGLIWCHRILCPQMKTFLLIPLSCRVAQTRKGKGDKNNPLRTIAKLCTTAT